MHTQTLGMQTLFAIGCKIITQTFNISFYSSCYYLFNSFCTSQRAACMHPHGADDLHLFYKDSPHAASTAGMTASS